MIYDPTRHHRRSIRLPTYDYTQAGAYFVTVVCRERALLLEDPSYRKIVDQSWLWLADQYEYVHLDEYVLMPNHLHGIIVIGDVCRGGSRTAPTARAKRKPLGRLIAAFKTVSTKRINEMRGTPGLPVWQRNYYEHVVRDDEDWTAFGSTSSTTRRAGKTTPRTPPANPRRGRPPCLPNGPSACPCIRIMAGRLL